VPDCGTAALGADVGVGVGRAGHGVLRGEHVRGAWTYKDEPCWEKPSADGVRTSSWWWNGRLFYVLLPRAGRSSDEWHAIHVA